MASVLWLINSYYKLKGSCNCQIHVSNTCLNQICATVTITVSAVELTDIAVTEFAKIEQKFIATVASTNAK